jgi:hypothetical protein
MGTSFRDGFAEICALSAIVLLVLGSPGAAADVPSPVATSWPEADSLFRKDPFWVGSDDAYSVDLGHGRIAWLFADTLIDSSARHERHGAAFIRNSVAIQKGYDPASASIKFYWGRKDGRPASFFPETEAEWYWPGGGTLIRGHLILFLMRVRAVTGGLGFEVFGSAAVLVDNPDADPPEWRSRVCHIPENARHVVPGSGSSFAEGRNLYAFGSVEPATHDIYVNRWPLSSALRGRFEDPEWWAGQSAWTAQSRPQPPARVSFSDGATEFTVHFSKRFHRYLEFQTVGFGPAIVAMRSAIRLTGPWSAPRAIFTPPERNRPRVMIYAAKAHPELAGADLVLTYATNSFELADVIRDQTLYYPRFVRLSFSKATGPRGKSAAPW